MVITRRDYVLMYIHYMLFGHPDSPYYWELPDVEDFDVKEWFG